MVCYVGAWTVDAVKATKMSEHAQELVKVNGVGSD